MKCGHDSPLFPEVPSFEADARLQPAGVKYDEGRFKRAGIVGRARSVTVAKFLTKFTKFSGYDLPAACQVSRRVTDALRGTRSCYQARDKHRCVLMKGLCERQG